MHVTFSKPRAGNALADASIHFDSNDGPLEGNRLEGFAIRTDGSKLFASVPSRQYTDKASGLVKYWDLLRFEGHGDGKWHFRNWLVEEYKRTSGADPQADGGEKGVPF